MLDLTVAGSSSENFPSSATALHPTPVETPWTAVTTACSTAPPQTSTIRPRTATVSQAAMATRLVPDCKVTFCGHISPPLTTTTMPGRKRFRSASGSMPPCIVARHQRGSCKLVFSTSAQTRAPRIGSPSSSTTRSRSGPRLDSTGPPLCSSPSRSRCWGASSTTATPACCWERNPTSQAPRATAATIAVAHDNCRRPFIGASRSARRRAAVRVRWPRRTRARVISGSKGARESAWTRIGTAQRLLSCTFARETS